MQCGPKRLIFDLETNGLLESVTTIHCCVIKNLDTGVVTRYRSDTGPSIDMALDQLCTADELIGHNICGYDIPVLRKLYPNFTYSAKLTDTLILARLIYSNQLALDLAKKIQLGHNLGKHSLEAWGIRLGKHKGDYSKLMKERGLDPWAAVNDDMVDYCANDIEVTALLLKRMTAENYSPRAIQLEHDVDMYCREQTEYGVWFNEPAAAELYSTLAAERSKLERDLIAAFGVWWAPCKKNAMGSPFAQTPKRTINSWVEHPEGAVVRKMPRTSKAANTTQIGWYVTATEGAAFTPIELREFNPSSRPHIADRLITKYGWKPQTFTDGGAPEVDEATLMHLDYPEVKMLIRYLLIDKRIGQIAEGKQAWLRVSKNSIIHGKVNTNAAVTGRATHSNPNLGQVPKVGVPWGAECRALFGARPGRWFVGADAAGLELRCLAHYMARWDKGAYGQSVLSDDKENEKDVHSVNTLALGLKPKQVYSLGGKSGKGRDFGKTFIYAFLYGAGDEKIGSIVGAGKQRGTALKKSFLAGLPALGKLLDAVKTRAIETRPLGGFVLGPDGRRIYVRSLHAALNTLLQGCGAIIMKQAMCNWHEAMKALGYKRGDDYAQVLWVHDEFQADCKTEEIAHICGKVMVDAIRKVTQDFNLQCPLDGEYKVGRNWSDTH